MMLSIIASVIVMVIAAVVVVAFLKVLSARLMTGKWPHQDAQSKEIYDYLLKNS